MPEINNPADTNGSGLKIYLRLLTYLKPLWGYFAVSIVGYLVFAASQPMLPKLMELIINAIESKDSSQQLYLPLFAMGIFVVRGLGSFFGSYFMALLSSHLVRTLTTDIFSHITRLPAKTYDATGSGQFIARMSASVSMVTGAATGAIKIIIREGFTVTFLLGYIFYTNWKLSLVFILIMPIIGLVVTYTSKRFRNISKKIQFISGDVMQSAKEMLAGFKVMKVFAAEDYENERFYQYNTDNMKQGLKMAKISAITTPVLQLIVAMAIAVIVYLLLMPEILAESTAGELIAYLTAVALLPKSIRQLSEVNATIQKGISGCQLIFELLDTPIEEDSGTITKDRVNGKINIKNLTFSYGNSNYDPDKSVLKNINLEIQPGKTIALVGSSGSGKSTLAALISRFYELDQGEVLIDDVNINDYVLSNLRSHIALVNQDVVLFRDTIANNIAYGCCRGSSEADIIQAAKSAHAHEFIMQQANGYKTEVGDNGWQLSGGQRQRIAIARAFLKDSPILILDEATSALDNESEREIQGALEDVKKGRTTIVIAHRLSTIENADTIFVMDKGKIVEQGDHKELLNLQGVYYQLHSSKER